jgi:pSer/pThr/pTyr-binding forkhead associated (FHA) protein
MTATVYKLTMRSGPVPGTTFLLEQEETTLGRDLTNEIPISDPEVSRRHARFLLRDDNVFLEDLGSTNGTFLNGERITSPQQLRKGDVITFGESIVMVYEKLLHEPDATVVTPHVEAAPTPRYTPPAPQPQYEPEDYQQLEESWDYQRPAYERPAPADAAAKPELPRKKKKAKQGGLPPWMIVLIVAIVVVVCVIAVTLYFMPASWWCAITFDALAGCPLP